MPFSLFVYYNEMVHNSKTTKDTTSAQENFFVLKRPIEWYQHQVSISWSDFVKSDLATNSAAQGGPEDGHRQKKMIGINRGHAHLNSCEEKSRFFQDVFEILQIC